MHHAPADGKFCDEYGNIMKSATGKMGYLNKCAHITLFQGHRNGGKSYFSISWIF
jgi:hypothetical protein